MTPQPPAQSKYSNTNNIPEIPRPNIQMIAEKLRSGEASLAQVLSQFSSLMRELLKVIEDFAGEQAKLSDDRKSKVEKMDKILSDLSEKCQAMQQALLYKEEKYDEKCREVERYKVICELSSRNVVNDNSYYLSDDLVNKPTDERGLKQESHVKTEERHTFAAPSASPYMGLKKHTKIHNDKVHLSQYVEPYVSDGPKPSQGDLGENRHDLLAQHYVGGHCKRKVDSLHDTRIKDRLEIMGGINVRGPRINPAPVSLAKIARPGSRAFEDPVDKKVKISITGQSNEIMSSSGSSAYQLKQRLTEKDLHRQVAEGCWTRIANGRRRKEWPF